MYLLEIRKETDEGLEKQKVSTKFGFRRKAWLQIILMIALSVTIFVNLITLQSQFVAVPSAFAFLVLAAVAMGRLFFSKEESFLRIALGMITFILIAALIGTVLILLAVYTELLSVSAVLIAGFVLFVLSFRKMNFEEESMPRIQGENSRNWIFYSVSLAFILLTAFAFYLLLRGRTGEGTTSVWVAIPSLFSPAFSAAFVCLLLGIFAKTARNGIKLGLVTIYSFLAHALFILVWYPGRYGDPWVHLGEARFIDATGASYAYSYLLQKFYIVDIIGGKVQYVLVVLFRRLLLIDIYWVHVLLIPLLWSVFVPLFSFKIAQLLIKKKTLTFPLLAAVSSILFSELILWGAISVPNSLAFLLLFFLIVSLLYWIDNGNKKFLLLSVLISVAVLFTHPVTGIFAGIFFLGAIVVRLRLPGTAKVFLFLVITLLYPLALIYRGATFSPTGLLNLGNAISFQSAFFSIPLILAFAGLLFGMKNKSAKVTSIGLLFLFYLTVVVSYYLTSYGMGDLPAGTDATRFVPMADFLAVPFVGLGFLMILNMLKRGFSRVSLDVSLKARASFPFRLGGAILVSLAITSLITLAMYQAYPQSEIVKVQPAGYEIDAVRYIDSSTNGRYVVLCDTNFATMGIAFLGSPYGYGGGARGMFGIPEWNWWTIQLYSQMVNNPSISIMKEALRTANATASYFVVSVREPQFEEVVQSMQDVMPVTRIFGEEKLYVYAYPAPIIKGAGSSVKVSFEDNSSMNAQTEFAYIAKSEVNYTLTISGHSRYNITDFPQNWAFQSSSINGVAREPDQSSDVNTFAQFSGLNPTDVLTVLWEANDIYPIVGWKDDSFKSGWQQNPFYAGTINPNITVSSNVLSLEWNFVPRSYQYYYYTKQVQLSTDNYPYVLVKWRATGPVAVIGVSYDSAKTDINPIIPYNSQSNDWIVSALQLDPGKTTAYITVGITNVGNQQTISGLFTVYVDYIMICAKQ